MSYIVAIVVLAVVVVIVAYVLGMYFRRREAGERPPSAARPLPKLFISSAEREEQAVINWLLSQAFEQTGVRVAEDKIAYSRIAEAARKAVQELRSQPSTRISLPFLTADASGPKHFEIRLTREVLKELARY
ncbi:MAG: Hsp70 family protein [Anaerolineales bacterium]|nr:Hsp70 family protein [Anaerolineales bacterium]